MTDNEFLNWLADRLVHVYGESPSVDFVHKLKSIALAKQEQGEPKQEEYLSKAYRLANELRCHLAIAPAPQQRTWVGLTDDEIDQGLCRTPYVMKSAEAWREGVRWAYHQLKEKNNA